ncbi:DsbA family protein [Actinomycetospora sp. CA-101289]|uniref:DsbA family protein n=1 Tax=Actinomycetospora sp. CA-101289 TaxID=3239893 RepID=UPI003D98B0AB
MTAPTARRRALLGGLVALVALAALGVPLLLGSATPAPRDTAAADPIVAARLEVPRRDPADPLALGRPDAPVVVAEWGDFRCPFCSLYATTTEPELVRRYVDAGLVRIEWHDFAYLGPQSVLAAHAARAAAAQGRFWEFHGALYADLRAGRGAVTEETLAATAGGLGLDVDRFRRDAADPAVAAAVRADQELGARLGVGGVPSFVVDDQLIFGAQPLPTFTSAIDAALARAR